MRFHCLGVGSIGSLVATSLAHLPSSPTVRLVVNKRAHAKSLFDAGAEGPTASFDRVGSLNPQGTGSLKIERNGLTRKTDGFEVEVVRSGSSLLPNVFEDARYRMETFERNDPIDVLFITTKSSQTLHAIKPLITRLNRHSTIVILQNGLGVLEGLIDQYWPDNNSSIPSSSSSSSSSSSTASDRSARPSFICALTTHGLWIKSPCHYVHAAVGHVNFGIVPNRSVLDAVAATPNPSWGDHFNNPVLNPRSLTSPQLDHLPESDATATLRETITALLESELNAEWQPLPILQISQLQKLAANIAINSLTAVLGVHNGALAHNAKAKEMIMMVAQECGKVFAAHLAMEEGVWEPPPLPTLVEDEDRFSSSIGVDKEPSKKPHSPPPSLADDHPLSPVSLAHYIRYLIHRTSINISSTLADLLNTPLGVAELPSVEWTRTEIDYINGYASALGRRYGLSTPTVDSLALLVKMREDMLRSGAVDRIIATRASPSNRQQPNPVPVDEDALKERIAPTYVPTPNSPPSWPKWKPIEVPDDTVAVFEAGRKVFWKGQGTKRQQEGAEERRARAEELAKNRLERLAAQRSRADYFK